MVPQNARKRPDRHVRTCFAIQYGAAYIREHVCASEYLQNLWEVAGSVLVPRTPQTIRSHPNPLPHILSNRASTLGTTFMSV